MPRRAGADHPHTYSLHGEEEPHGIVGARARPGPGAGLRRRSPLASRLLSELYARAHPVLLSHLALQSLAGRAAGEVFEEDDVVDLLVLGGNPLVVPGDRFRPRVRRP